MAAALWVGIGGFLGANARYFLTSWSAGWLPAWLNGRFFHPTLIVNCIGSFLMAAFIAWASERAIVPEPTRQFLAIGFFGAFTTFSSFTLDALSLQGERGWWLALMSVLAHNALCLAAAYLGWRLMTVG